MRVRVPTWSARIAIAIAILGGWQAFSGGLIDPVFVSSPLAVVERLAELFLSGSIWPHLRVTLTALVTGYVIGAALGIVVGTGLGRAPRVAATLEPFIMAFYSIPKIALAPIFIVWLGIGIASKVAVVVLNTFFLVFFSTFGGMREIDEELVILARIMGASRPLVTRRILLPMAAPAVLLGLRTAVPYAMIGAIIAEFIASNRGLGYYVLFSTSTYDTAGVFAGITILVAIVLGLNQALLWLERRALRWRIKTAEIVVSI